MKCVVITGFWKSVYLLLVVKKLATALHLLQCSSSILDHFKRKFNAYYFIYEKIILSISSTFVCFIEGKSKVFIDEMRTSENSLRAPILYLPIIDTWLYKWVEEVLCKYS